MKEQKKSAEYVKGYKQGKSDAYSEIVHLLLTGMIGAALYSGMKGFNEAVSRMRKQAAEQRGKEGEKKK